MVLYGAMNYFEARTGITSIKQRFLSTIHKAYFPIAQASSSAILFVNVMLK
jgi:hypothetical protein